MIRYIEGQRLPDPAQLHLLSQLLKVAPEKLYPEYYIDFGTHKRRKHGNWCNSILEELVDRGWSIKKFSHECGISLGRAYGLISWKYPPTEKILQKLEVCLKKNRDEFWLDWKQKQWQHYHRRRYLDER